MPDMRGVFWARGPSFKKWKKVNWIKLVDEYQVLHKIFFEERKFNLVLIFFASMG